MIGLWRLLGRLVLWGGCCVAAVRSPAAEPDYLKHRWELEPALGASWIEPPVVARVTFDPTRIADGDLEQCLAEAQRVVIYAPHAEREGRAQTLAAILDRLKAGVDNRQVRQALISAAVALGSAEDAPAIWAAASEHAEGRLIVERALTAWQSPLALPAWRQRVQSTTASSGALLTAIDGLGRLGSSGDGRPLQGLVDNDRLVMPVRIAAARALGNLVTSGLEDLAAELSSADLPHIELLVAHLLADHTSGAALQQLEEVLESDLAPAQSQAFRSLVRANADRARAWAPQLIVHRDSTLRLQVVELLGTFDDAEAVRDTAEALSDPHSKVRGLARRVLQQQAAGSLRPVIDEIVSHMLSNADAEALEQTVVLVGDLEDRRRCPRLVELLEHPDPRVSVSAAWALQEMVDSEALLDSMLRHATRMTDRLAAKQPVSEAEIVRLAFVFEAFGRNRYQPATEMLRLYVPKDFYVMRNLTRTSAIWALGRILEDSRDERLAAQLARRLHDDNEDFPEAETVKYVAALTLGYLGVPASRKQLERHPERPPFPIGLARAWALERLP